jgi:capsular polysaccharide biosynthesis protein
MNINRFLNTIARMLWLVILLGIIGGGITAYKSYYLTTKMYKAETSVYAMKKGQTKGGGESLEYQDVMLSRQLIIDYQEIVVSGRVLDLAVKRLVKYNISQSELERMISVESKNDSSVIGISAEADNAEVAAKASNEVTQAFIVCLREITNDRIVGILNEAKVPEQPIPDNSLKNIIIGILAGVVAALTIIYIRELFDTAIRYPEDIKHNTELNIVGIIPRYGIK